MQEPLRQRIKTILGTATLLLAVPAFAMGSFSTSALRFLAAARPHATRHVPATAQARHRPADAGNVLTAWQNTQSIIDGPANISAMNNAEVQAIASTLPGMTFGTPRYNAAQVDLAATISASQAFESNYKVISANSTPYLNANLISAFLHGEANAFTALGQISTDPFTQSILVQKANVLNQEINAFEAWYKGASSNPDSNTVLQQLNTFTVSFRTFSQTFTAFQVQEINNGTISSSQFTYTAPVF